MSKANELARDAALARDIDSIDRYLTSVYPNDTYYLSNVLSGMLETAIKMELWPVDGSSFPATIPAKRRAMKAGLEAAIEVAQDLIERYNLK